MAHRAIGTFLLCILGVVGFSTSTHAQQWSLTSAKGDWKSMLFGFAGGVAVHELGHVAVAEAKGYNVDYDGLSIVYPDSDISDDGRLQVSSAGFQFQWLLSEYLFARHAKRSPAKPISNKAAGAILAHIGISAAYLTFLKNHENGDITGMSVASGTSRDKLALLMAIPAALDSWRLFGKNSPAWLPKVSAAAKGLGIAAVWAF